LTNLQVLAYTCITAKFQRRSSTNVRLTEGSLYNKFHIERPPKLGFWGDLAKIFGGKVHSSSELRVFRHLGPDLTPRVVALCMGIAICHRRKFGHVWGFQAALPEVARILRWKNRNHSAM